MCVCVCVCIYNVQREVSCGKQSLCEYAAAF